VSGSGAGGAANLPAVPATIDTESGASFRGLPRIAGRTMPPVTTFP
jgi:hypothetical protein